jgi:hypothetical protein
MRFEKPLEFVKISADELGDEILNAEVRVY